MGKVNRVLIVEDLPSDAELTEREIGKALGSCEFRRVETREAYLAALEACCPELIVSDFKLPHFDGLSALRLALERCPDVPFIIVTGSMNEDTAVECMKAGAWDYVIKEHVKRLGPAVESAMEQQRVRMEHKRAQSELRESEARFRDMFERSTIGKAMTACDGKLLKVNRAFADMLGLSTEELQQLTLAGITHPDDVPESLECVRALLAGERATYRMEKRYRHRDGHWVFADTSATLLRPVQGTPRCMLASIVDISKRKRAEEVMRASEAHYQQLVSNTDTGFVVIDDKGIVLSANEPYQRLAGAQRIEDVIGHSVTEWTAPDEKEKNAQAVARCAEHGFIDNFETVYQYADGTRIDVSINAAVDQVFEGGVRIASLCRNITERKRAESALRESEQRLRRFYESDLVGAVYWNMRGKITDANDKFLEMVGYTRADLAAGHIDWVGMTPPEYRQLDESSLAELKATGRNKAAFEKEYIRKDGTRLPILIAGAMLDGERESGVAFVLDISERKQAEAERTKLEAQLRGAQRMEAIGLLAGGVAHDFNNLLSVILCGTEFAMESARENDRVRDELLEVKKAGERAVGLTRQLLAFSRKQVLQPDVLNLNQIATGVEKMLRRILGEDIDYVQTLAPDLGMVWADPGQIEQVLMNLVVNARDAMPEGGKLFIETSNAELDEDYASHHVAVLPGPYVLLAVTDTGCGMDPQTMARVFEPFFTTKETGKGTGLGLSTVYGIVKQSGGYIWVDSEPGHGTMFKIYLPIAHETVAAAPKVKPVLTSTRGTETVLIVDDEEAIHAIVSRILGSAGYTVLTAATANEALRICKTHQGNLHLLLTDVVMPHMGGRLLAEHVAALRSGIKVLYMSGYTDDAIAHHGTLGPGTHFIAKPFSAADLTNKVREVLGLGTANLAQGFDHTFAVPSAVTDTTLDRDTLRALAPQILDNLRKAATAARYDEALDLIESIRPANPNLATRLRRMVEAYDYDGVLDLLGR